MTLRPLPPVDGAQDEQRRPVSLPLAGAATVLILTTVHHVYGAERFQTPWRYHAAFVAIPALLVLVAARALCRRQPDSVPGRIAFGVFVLVSILVPIALIGLFEGGYNHVLKNILYFGGAAPENLTTLFPPPRYEMPSDLFFEVTGIAQFPAALWAIASLSRALRRDRHHDRS